MSVGFSISRQLLGAFAAVAASVLVIGAASVDGVSQLVRINHQVAGEQAERYTLVLRFERDVALNVARTWSVLRSADKTYLASIRREIEQASQGISSLQEQINAQQWDEKSRAILDRALQDRDEYRKFRAQMIAMHERGDVIGYLSEEKLTDLMKRYQTTLGELAEQQRAQFESTAKLAADTADQTKALVFGSLAGALVVIAILGIWISRRLTRRVRLATSVVKAVAEGNLRAEIHAEGSDEIAELLSSLGEMSSRLSGLIVSIGQTAGSLRNASSEISAGSVDLSERTEKAASSLQQTGASMMQMSTSVRSNADSASQANQLAMSASEVAQRGGAVVGQVVTTMDGITASSRRIAEIIGVIDAIAFQTNILALNAAVEAARAGEQGRGFAVVAGEVRNLAQRSAEAASQIKGLITSSVSEVESGSRLVKEAGSTMQEIVTSVSRVTDIIGEISSATQEQSAQISQITSAIGQLESMTQQNAALVEESTAAVDSLTRQAEALTQSVARFDVGSDGSARSTPTATSGARSPLAKLASPTSVVSAPCAAISPGRQGTEPAAKPLPVQPRAPLSAALPARRAASSSAETSSQNPSQPAVVRVAASPDKAVASSVESEDDWETF
jgi:methyl-accepting chemotaxis protein